MALFKDCSNINWKYICCFWIEIIKVKQLWWKMLQFQNFPISMEIQDFYYQLYRYFKVMNRCRNDWLRLWSRVHMHLRRHTKTEGNYYYFVFFVSAFIRYIIIKRVTQTWIFQLFWMFVTTDDCRRLT